MKDISHLPEHEHYIKYKCKDVRAVYSTGIYFKDENNPENSGINFGFFGHPNPLSKRNQAQILIAINAICNTEFELEE